MTEYSDYLVYYLDKETGETEVVSVYKVESEEEARKEADYSLSFTEGGWYEIKSIEKVEGSSSEEQIVRRTHKTRGRIIRTESGRD